MTGPLDGVVQICGYLIGIVAILPIFLMCLFANPVIISRNWDNVCDDQSPVSLCAWLTANSCVTLGLSFVAIGLFFVAIFGDWNNEKKNWEKVEKFVNKALFVHGFIFFGFTFAWLCFGGWLIFGSGPAAACYSTDLGRMTVANIAGQIVACALGWTLWLAVIKTM